MPTKRGRRPSQQEVWALAEDAYRQTFNPQPSQAPFVDSTARYKLGGGKRGGGKSYTMTNALVTIALDYPGSVIFVGRRDLKDFHDTTQKFLEKAIPRGLLYDHNQQHKEYWIDTKRSLETGDPRFRSLIRYGELKDPGSILSGEINAFGIDEAFEVPQLAFSHLGASLRHVLPDGTVPPYFGLLTTNPSPGWLMDVFPVMPSEIMLYKHLCEKYGDSWGKVPTPERAQYPRKWVNYDYAYFPFGAEDIQEILPPGYFNNIRDLYENEGQAMLARMVYGEWSVSLEGLVYNLLPVHRWNPPEIGKRLYRDDQPVMLGIDPSNGAGCFAATVWQVSGAKKMVVDEYKVQGATDDDFIDWLHYQPYANRIIDAVCDSARPDTIKRLQAKGLPVRGAGKKDVTAQINAVKELMRLDPTTGESNFIIDESRCPQLVREFGLRCWKTQKPDGPKTPDEPLKRNDDLLNSCEYLVRDKWPIASMSDSFEYADSVAHTPLFLSRQRSGRRRR